MKRRLKDSKDAAKYRNELLTFQNGTDPIINEKITTPVLDHFHGANQHCREVLQNEVNAFEGKVYNSYNRYVKHLTDMPLPEILRNLADYLERNGSIPDDEQVIHHTALTVDVNKFKRLSSTEQCKILEKYNVVPGKNVKKRALQVRKLIKDSVLNINECIIDIKKGA